MGWPGARRTYGQAAACDASRASAPVDLNAAMAPINQGMQGLPVQLQIPPFAGNITWDSTMPVRFNPAVGILVINGAPIPPATIGAGQQTGYIPPYAPDGRIGTMPDRGAPGGFTIGQSGIGHIGRPFHGLQHVVMRGLDPSGPLYPVLEETP